MKSVKLGVIQFNFRLFEKGYIQGLQDLAFNAFLLSAIMTTISFVSGHGDGVKVLLEYSVYFLIASVIMVLINYLNHKWFS